MTRTIPDHYELTEEEFNELLRLANDYHRNAVRCVDAKAYIAGCAASGAMLEAALIAMIHIEWKQIPSTFKSPRKGGIPKPLLDWQFDDLLEAAHAAGWLQKTSHFSESFALAKPEPGDYASHVRILRNLIHPQRYMRDHFKRRVTKKMLEYALEAAELIGQRLGKLVEKELAKRL